MRVLSVVVLTASLVGLSSAAKIIPVTVGQNGLTFTPDVIHARHGDVVEFIFYPRNHSVVAGKFGEACRPADHDGFFSGFFPTAQGTVHVSSVFFFFFFFVFFFAPFSNCS
jgi:plastocyanin